MAKVLALLVITLVCLIVNTRGQTSAEKPFGGQAFDEIIVTSDLNVKRRSKEDRQGKKLTNVPSETSGPTKNLSAFASRLVSRDGSRVTPEKREKREIMSRQKRAFFHWG